MTAVGTIMLVALFVSMAGSPGDVTAQAPHPLNPKAAQEYASDTEKAARGDPEAAFRVGEAFESGRLGGLKDLKKALTFYRLAAQKGHQQAAARVAQIEVELGLTVGAPPSLRPAFSEILPMFEREYGAVVHIVYTPSKTLLRQIEKGAPIDVFLSAGVEEVEYLHKKGLTLNGRPRIFAQTSLVLVMSSDSRETMISLRDALANRTTRIALGDPETSYLGEVTARVLTKLSPTYKSRFNILYAPHSEDIMDLIRTGKADVGLIYRVNTVDSVYVRISDETLMETPVPIQFGQAVASTCRASLRSVADQFSDFLMTTHVQKLLTKYGFD
ncbi:MAG TPA: molybdate ABC transporter substrate-binding protein [Nitrospiraceae bacterium]|nr:molybdate ABC transporter substrate-binding protein [Nitrospiraceae bacterium]